MGATPIADGRHLSVDAEFAEDLAIRYADTHHGLRTAGYVSGQAYGAARDRCMATLFEEIAKAHGVPAAKVSGSLGQNRGDIDLAIILPFAVLGCFAAMAVAHAIWRRYPTAEHGVIPGLVMSLFISLVFAVGATMVGEVWCGIAESYRIGNGHMSYRFQRLLWARHQPEAFGGAVIVFWLAAVIRMRRV